MTTTEVAVATTIEMIIIVVEIEDNVAVGAEVVECLTRRLVTSVKMPRGSTCTPINWLILMTLTMVRTKRSPKTKIMVSSTSTSNPRAIVAEEATDLAPRVVRVSEEVEATEIEMIGVGRDGMRRSISTFRTTSETKRPLVSCLAVVYRLSVKNFKFDLAARTK